MNKCVVCHVFEVGDDETICASCLIDAQEAVVEARREKEEDEKDPT